ncbi:hypothetical protein BURMUCGD1_5624 [Burkholderia multivorans CGD1]|nr:hypothetical protein BURMUCGD1_5624 [Burkholderia multivorans CGD1]
MDCQTPPNDMGRTRVRHSLDRTCRRPTDHATDDAGEA